MNNDGALDYSLHSVRDKEEKIKQYHLVKTVI